LPASQSSNPFFFFLPTPPPPSSPLFPYTTLFRSHQGRHHGIAGAPVRKVLGKGALDAHRLGHPRHHNGAVVPAMGHFKQTIALLNRKSTRLNSSHVKISYAVFCLKKKKKDRGGS